MTSGFHRQDRALLCDGVLASNYNFRPRPAEVLVDGGVARVIRRREAHEDLVRLEAE